MISPVPAVDAFIYLSKPFTQDELKKKIKGLLEYRKGSFERYLKKLKVSYTPMFQETLTKLSRL